jgi:hypothetical protein
VATPSPGRYVPDGPRMKVPAGWQADEGYDKVGINGRGLCRL